MIPGRYDFAIFRGDSERLVVILAEPVMGSTDMTPVILGDRVLRWRIALPPAEPTTFMSGGGGVETINPYGLYWIDLTPELTSLFPEDNPVRYSISMIDGSHVDTWIVGNIIARSMKWRT